MSQTSSQYIAVGQRVIRDGSAPKGGIVMCNGCRWPMRKSVKGHATKPLCRDCRIAEVAELRRVMAELSSIRGEL